MDVTVLCDAVAVFPEPIAEALPEWSAAHQAWTDAHLPGNVAPGGGWFLHFHSYLVTTQSTAILVDTGIGPAGGGAAQWLGTTGRLPDLLAAVGVTPAEIETVILTHIHLDHAGWNTAGDAARFPNATYVAQQAELDHARGSTTYRDLIEPLGDQVRGVRGRTEIAGVRLWPTPGHTPGHQSVVTDRAVLGGDVLVHPAQARWPELTYVYEQEPVVAVTSRREVLRLAAATGLPIAAAHPETVLTSAGLPLGQAAPMGVVRRAVCAPQRL